MSEFDLDIFEAFDYKSKEDKTLEPLIIKK